MKDRDEILSASIVQVVMDEQVDIRQAILAFVEKLDGQYEAVQVILFGSRARGDHQPDSNTDVAVILRGAPEEFVETKLVSQSLLMMCCSRPASAFTHFRFGKSNGASQSATLTRQF